VECHLKLHIDIDTDITLHYITESRPNASRNLAATTNFVNLNNILYFIIVHSTSNLITNTK